MPALCAAFGSFHPKSSRRYFIRVLTTVRVLPFFLTFTLIRCSTLTVSTFGVRSYSDQRYWSIQASGSRHESRALELAVRLSAFCTGSVELAVATSTDGAAGSDIEKMVPPVALSAIPIEPVVSLASFGAGSGDLSDAIGTGRVARPGISRGSDKLPLPISATEAPRSPGVVA